MNEAGAVPSTLSAGLLMYRRAGPDIEVLLGHPGGPFHARRDAGAWTIPKGMVEAGEAVLAAACREFTEETGLLPQGPWLDLGEVRQKGGKRVRAWAFAGDADPATLHSNPVILEWPAGTGRRITFPELDRYAWFAPAETAAHINPAQQAFIERLLLQLAGAAAG